MVLVVDNGSSLESVERLREASNRQEISLIENHENLGIATALNIGVRWATEQGYKAVVLFDQDSTIKESFLKALLAAYLSKSPRTRVAMIAPRHWDRNAKQWLSSRLREDGNLEVAITSGSMIPLSVFKECGWFRDDFVIDMVDTEYCFRARKQGFQIVLATDAVLEHSIGALQHHSLLGIKTVRASHHSAARRYYMTRNRLVTLFKYWRLERSLLYHVPRSIIMETIIVGLFEEQRIRKFTNTFRGIVDALLGNMGKRVEL
jgi:rhamnosyltransferase